MSALLVAASISASGIAAADDIASVNFTASGPDRDLPVGKSFYVAGTATTVTQAVQAIVVRKGSPRIGGGSGPTCAELRTELGHFAAEAPATGELDAQFKPLPSGRRSTAKIWEHAAGEALVTAAWQRGELAGAQPYKLLVPGDTDFFRAGYAYCLFVFTQDQLKINVEAKVRAAFDNHLRAYDRCVSTDAEARSPLRKAKAALTADGETSDAQRKELDAKLAALDALRESCEQAATEALVAALDATGARNTSTLIDAAEKLRTTPLALRYLLESWRAATDVTATVARTFVQRVDLAAFTPIAETDPNPDARLASYIAKLLARRDGLFAQITDKSLTYATLDGKTEIKYLGFRDDGKLAGSTDKTAARTVPLALRLDDLPIANTAITARDLIEATQGRLRLSRYLSLKATAQDLTGELAAEYGADDKQLAGLASLRDRVGGLAEAMRRALAASAGFDCKSGKYPPGGKLPSTPEQTLGEWLRCRPVVLDACAELSADWSARGVAAPPECRANDKAWPGYRYVGANPLDTIAVAAGDLLDAHATWRDARKIMLSESLRTTAVVSEAKIGFTQETWVGSYLTPNLGYAHIPYASATLTYAAIQIHAVPNPVDDPQWSHGVDDWARAVAVEIGFAISAGSFGPDGRLDGPWSLPPLFFGLAVHPLPYASITGGFTLDDVRTTTLTGQRRHVDAFGFIGFSLQANLPDLLYKKLGYGLKTTVDK